EHALDIAGDGGIPRLALELLELDVIFAVGQEQKRFEPRLAYKMAAGLYHGIDNGRLAPRLQALDALHRGLEVFVGIPEQGVQNALNAVAAGHDRLLVTEGPHPHRPSGAEH